MRRVRHRGPRDWVVGLLVLAVTALACALAFTKEVPFRDHTTVRAALVDAQGVRRGVPVRVAGVEVGKVRDVESRAGGGAMVTIRLRERGLPLHTDARIKVRPRLFFEGNPFLDLSPGSPSAPVLGDGDVLPVSQSSSSVDFDELLGLLDRSSREDLSIILREYGKAVKGSAKAVNRTIPLTEDAYRDSSIVARAQQGERPGQLAEYFRATARFNRALDADPEALQTLITDLRRTAGAFADEDEKLRETLVELPRLLRTGTPALRELGEGLPPLRRLVADLRTSAREAPPALDAQLGLARQLRGLVRRSELRGLAADLRATTPALAEVNRVSVPAGEQGRLLSSCQARNLAPVSKQEVPDPNHPASGKVYEETAYVLTGLAGESRAGDANGQWIRVYLSTGNEAYQVADDTFLLNDRPILGTNPPPPRRRSPLRPDVPCETQDLPDLRTQAGSPPPRVRLQAPPARRLARARETTTKWLEKELARTGLGGIRVRSQELTRAEMQRMGK